MTDLLQTLVSGLTAGTIYGGLALALVYIFRSTGVVNFAQGEMAMISTFVVVSFHLLGLPLVLAIAASMVVSFAFGLIIERVLVRPVSGRGDLSPSVVTIGLFLGLNGIAGWIWGLSPRTLPSVFPRESISLGGVRVGIDAIGSILVLLAFVSLLFLLFERTRVGLMMRAAASNPESARLSGVPVSRLLMMGWGLAAAVGTLAGALIAPSVFVSPAMMGPVFIYALAAAALGGLGSPIGALVGGWVIGMAEALVSGYVDVLGSDLTIVVPLVIIFLVLLVRPAGLFGAQEVVRV